MATTRESHATETMVTILEFDHSVLAVNDLLLAERFYANVLGEIFGTAVTVEHREMISTEELLYRAHHGSPATRLQQHGLYDRKNEGIRVAAPQGSVQVGDALMPLMVHRTHVQEPPPEQLRGTPRHAFPVTRDRMERAVEVLRRHGVPFEGPVEHAPPCPVARSVYFKDPSSNFLELCEARGSQ